MPRRQPFTLLCQTAARLASPRRADLHTHTTVSDGDFTPSQLVLQARTAGLAAIAITDHDTTHGYVEAAATAESLTSKKVDVLRGVEISTHHEGREYHLLGYFFDERAAALEEGLAAIRDRRRVRFRSFLEAFAVQGVVIPDHLLASQVDANIAVGRRNLAKLLVAAGHMNTLHIAFLKYILPAQVPASHSVPIAEALGWIHEGNGLASLAHPPSDTSLDLLTALQRLGLDAVEVNCPSASYSHSENLKSWTATLSLGQTAGSDYHGAGHVLGSRTISYEDCTALRAKCRSNPPG